MRILQIIDSLPDTSGGARFVTNLSKSLKLKGHEVEVLLFNCKKTQFISELESAKIKYHVIGRSDNFVLSILKIRKAAQIIENFDLCHVHIFPASYFISIAKKIFNFSQPIVFTEHNAFNRRATNFVFKYIEKFVYKSFNTVVGITPAVKEFILNNLKVKEEKVKVIINGVDLESVRQCIQFDRTLLNLKSSDIIVLMAARFSKQKDQKTLIKAIELLPENYKLVLAGDGENLESCSKYISNLGIQSKVYLLGNRKDIYNLMKMSDINVLSSFYEGFGLSIVEAMSIGKPSLGSNVAGMDKVIDGAGLLFEVGDYKQLAEYIFNLGTDKMYYEKISLRCRERANMFDLVKMTESYLDVYCDALNKNR
ncbi:glycosyltransferase [Myroides marinus]|uniref:glycosyltransferase n=1 Tax=Myroides marinus TaxID=703342 RepID=UPI002575921E|nr:glycosyltransferase [Myroides marinus]MDM1503173.1 glycosyltransferase [Myroides marinus]